ncbi:MAG TPA: amino acid adenylation domain-containing protein, partial [Longimicrobiaceae bacterium]|nr:amino acid adenylation domain-containing protein [Longimicrobiaceae bacterium]
MENVESVFPLSPAQQEILLRILRTPDRDEYVEQICWTMEGELDAAAFARAWQLVVDRHPVLRTVFFWEGLEEPLQVVRRTARITVRAEDWSADHAERPARLERLLVEERTRAFDYSAAPLMRVVQLRAGEREHHFVWSYHHLLLDGWSGALCLREVLAAYEALCGGREPAPGPVHPYGAYLEWLRRQDPAEAERFWRGALAGFRETTPVAAERSGTRSGEEGDRYGVVSRVTTGALAGRLRGEGRRQRVTLNTLFQAAWGLVLGRYAAERDAVFGSVAAGRPASLPGSDAMLGVFISTVPTRVRVEPAARVASWLRGLQAEQAEARRFEHVGPGRIQGWSEVPRGRKLFDTLLVFQNLPDIRFSGAGVAGVEIRDLRRVATRAGLGYGLLLEVTPGRELELLLRFDEARFDADTAERMLGHLETVLDAMVSRPDGRVGGVALVDSAERHTLVERWNATAAGFAREARIHDLVAAPAAGRPDAPAVVCGPRVVSYAEFHARATALARRLRALGVGPEVRVALLLDRSVELAVSILAVLRAGGAFVPLDPEYPAERLAFVLRDSGAALVLTRAVLRERLGETGATVVCLDELDASREPGEAFEDRGVADNLAYLCYTSGSTGRPKAVMVSHRSLVAYSQAMVRALGLAGDDRFLQFASPGFDVLIEELFPAWMAGAAVVFPEGEPPGSPAELMAMVEAQGVTSLELPTAYWHEWMRQVAEEGGYVPACVRRVLVGGERVLPERLRAWAGQEAALVHVFGLTETTVTTTVLHLDPGEDGSGWANLPVGRPVENARVYVLDDEGNPVPMGVPGEMYVGGEGVARGYLGQPELTAGRYLPDALSGEAGGRLYRTGDRVRWLADGNLEFLGRMDQQVKVRGYRIEPAEVEAVLRGHASVRDAVVEVREDAHGEKRLVGYVVPEGGRPSAAELRAHLELHLPAYMVPGAFVELDALPLTPHGKLDRRALPAPGTVARESRVAPRTPVEEILGGIWAEVLGIEQVGATDDFFELGGHSLVAMRVISRIRATLGVELPLRALFETPTVAGLAGRVATVRREGPGTEAPPLVPGPRDVAPLPLSFAQQRLWLVHRMDPESAAYNMPSALRVHGRLELRALERALSAVLRRHEALRTRFPAPHGEPVQQIERARPAALPVVDLAGLPEERREFELERLSAEEARRPFSLATGPLLRTTVLRLGDTDAAVLFTLHHIVSDGWSIGILIREVSALYAAFSRGEAPDLPELPVQYADYAAWQRAWLSGAALEARIGYWREHLSEAPALLELPTDRPRPVVAGDAGARIGFAVGGATAAALRALSRREGATLFMTLLAGWQLLLGRYAGQEDVVVGSPVAGRDRVETEGLIGFFVNTLALRGDLSGDPPFRALLARVRDSTLGAYAHQDLPFERLVEELSPGRDTGRHPLFQVLFDLQNTPEQLLLLPGLTLEARDTRSGATPFDLALSVTEEEEGLAAELEYATEIFDPATAERLAAHYATLLEGIAAHPERSLSDLPLLTGAERATLLTEWNATGWEYPRGSTLHALFAGQAARTPGAPAVVFEGATVGYAELDARANRLARHLLARGVAAEDRVGICVERGPGMAVAILAALKAGAAYVPLDPEYPVERLAHLLADSGARLVVTERAVAARLPETTAGTVCLDAERERIEAYPAGAPGVDVAPESLAYVIYTSGSTGRPRGVAVPHRAVVSFATEMAARLGLGPSDRFLQFASPGFDVVVEEIFPAWLSGAAVVFTTGNLFSPAELLRILREEGVTGVELPTAYWHEWVYQLARGGARLPAHLRQVIVGGERVLPERLAEWSSLGLPLIHVFGLTETACTSTSLRLEAGDDGARWPNLPVGRPHGNVRLYVLDPALHPVPTGVPGELFIGGEGVARGYHGMPAPTAERFVPDPFGGAQGARLYRTGDRVRWLADGNLEFLGRIDQQVKIRGFRVEPAEVEAALAAHPAVREAVVAVREEGDDRTLAAYLTPAGDRPATAGELREWLGRELPPYMVPSAFVFLPELPLTAHGKLDRRALPAPAPVAVERAYAPPRTPGEEVLAGIWGEVLGV